MNFDSLLDIVEAVVKNVGPEGTHHLGGGWYGQKEGIALYRKVDGKFKPVSDIAVNLSLDKDSAGTLIGKVVTNEKGEATAIIPATLKNQWNSSI